MRDTRRHPDVEMAEGLAKDNPQFATRPVGWELFAIIVVTALIVGVIALRFIVYS